MKLNKNAVMPLVELEPDSFTTEECCEAQRDADWEVYQILVTGVTEWRKPCQLEEPGIEPPTGVPEHLLPTPTVLAAATLWSLARRSVRTAVVK